MSAEAAAIVHTFPVGNRMVTLTAQAPQRGQVANLAMEWDPTIPTRLTKRELRQYRAGRVHSVTFCSASIFALIMTPTGPMKALTLKVPPLSYRRGGARLLGGGGLGKGERCRSA
jgi:hypothetical protein